MWTISNSTQCYTQDKSIFLCNKILPDSQICNMSIHVTESDRGFAKFEKLKDNFDWFYSNYE